jgi:hypothetical protein
MSETTCQDILRKINFIEADIEIQKQILFSIPSDQKEEMEKTVQLIADKTTEIKKLREEIKSIDPEQYEQIMVFENAIQAFKKLASENKFQAIINRNVGEDCSLALHNGKSAECLIKACDSDENWTIITLEGQIEQFSKAEVSEKPPKDPEPPAGTPFVS